MIDLNITFERDVSPRQKNFKVIINGEHRATFHSNMTYGRKGYTLKALDQHSPVKGAYAGNHWHIITKEDFSNVVRKSITEIPTVAQIERSLLIDKAEKENTQRNEKNAARQHQMKRALIAEGLSYLLKETSLDAERRDMAENLVKRYTASNWDGWF